MKHGLAAIAVILPILLAGCDSGPAQNAPPLELPNPTAADLAAHGSLGDWERASSDEKTAFLETVATTRAGDILKAAPAASTDDAMTASIIYFRQCMDAFVFAGADDKSMPVSSMLTQCEIGFSTANAQNYLARVYQAKQAVASGAQPIGPEPLPAKDTGATAKNIEEPEHYPPPDFGE